MDIDNDELNLSLKSAKDKILLLSTSTSTSTSAFTIKKPINNWQLYIKTMSDEVKKSTKLPLNKCFGLLGQTWRNMSKIDRNNWTLLATNKQSIDETTQQVIISSARDVVLKLIQPQININIPLN